MFRRSLFVLFLFSSISSVFAENKIAAVTQPIPIKEITGFEHYSSIVKNLIIMAQSLTEKNLTYLYGSSDPQSGGMDCSGTIYYLLSQTKLNDVPRQANEMYVWLEKNNVLHKVTSENFESSELSSLKPGDLLFWSGTYNIKRTPPITHVMLYLGKNNKNQHLMFGASNGRTYQNKKMWGVSVFDFKLTTNKETSKFEGYGCIPNLTCGAH